MLKISDLRLREVINVADGKMLGTIRDVELDIEEGRVRAFILPGAGSKVWGLIGRGEELIVPWENVRTIGIDCILVEVPPCMEPRRRKVG
ncbi:MAG: YlmC/YmxH family sporulation protein [Clostridia bacterium]|nr:YlmC/YmxH family sporulation protein [Clostridia bacterium]